MKVADDAPMDKRIVIHHTQGAYAGLWQIVGAESQLDSKTGPDLPTFVESVQFLDHEGGASLAAVKPHYVLYRETMPEPATGRLGDFHPRQA